MTSLSNLNSYGCNNGLKAVEKIDFGPNALISAQCIKNPDTVTDTYGFRLDYEAETYGGVIDHTQDKDEFLKYSSKEECEQGRIDSRDKHFHGRRVDNMTECWQIKIPEGYTLQIKFDFIEK